MSLDDTNAAALEALQAEYPFLRVFRNERNLGIDGNILHAVDVNTCRHAWLLGEDDRLVPGAVARVLGVLEKEGVTKIDAVGKPFDPNYHQAVMRVPSDEYDDDVVVEVLQEGYLLGDKTLRPAMVKVAFNG